MKNSINGEIKKVRYSRHVNKAEWRVGLIFVNVGESMSVMQFRTNIN